MTASPLSYGPFISKAQAKAQGIKQYFTGKPCKTSARKHALKTAKKIIQKAPANKTTSTIGIRISHFFTKPVPPNGITRQNPPSSYPHETANPAPGSA